MVSDVMAIKRLFGSDSFKGTNFGPGVNNAIVFTCLPAAKTGALSGHHPVGCSSHV